MALALTRPSPELSVETVGCASPAGPDAEIAERGNRHHRHVERIGDGRRWNTAGALRNVEGASRGGSEFRAAKRTRRVACVRNTARRDRNKAQTFDKLTSDRKTASIVIVTSRRSVPVIIRIGYAKPQLRGRIRDEERLGRSRSRASQPIAYIKHLIEQGRKR